MIDEKLWQKCRRLLKGKSKPTEKNSLIGSVEGQDIYLSNFDWYMIHGPAEMLDAHEGFNSTEDPKVKPPGCHVDYQMSAHNWPFILYHELLEVRNMKKFMKGGMSRSKAYEKAHEISNRDEKQLRIRMGVGK